jgi:hypothetical protein
LKMRPKSAAAKPFTSHTNRKNGQIGGKFAGSSSLAALAAGLVLGGGVLSAPSAYALSGILATGSGPGPLTVSAPDLVMETDGDGINATNNSPGTDLTITATEVSGSKDGIDARNNGTGALLVTSTGSVTATNLGIRAINFGTDLTVATASVSGSTGINARKFNRKTVLRLARVNVTVDGKNARRWCRWSGVFGDVEQSAHDCPIGTFKPYIAHDCTICRSDALGEKRACQNDSQSNQDQPPTRFCAYGTSHIFICD